MLFLPPSAETFKPTFYGIPTVIILQSCAIDMWHIVQMVDMEVGWLCVCNETQSGDFILSQVVLPSQECHTATTELTASGLIDAGMQLLREDDAAGIEPSSEDYRFNHLTCWMHSHHKMGVSPSDQDDKQMADFCRMGGDRNSTYVRGIANQDGKIEFTVYYKCSKCWKVVKDVPWRVQYEQLKDVEERWAEAVKQRVKHIRSTTGVLGRARSSQSPNRSRGGRWKS